jgi:NADH-quinone oxidoreductase subunit M
MVELHLPWLELTIITPLIGVLFVFRQRDPEIARKRALIVTGLTLCLSLGAWEDFNTLHTFEAHDHWDVISPLLGADAVVIDELSAPLLPLAALLYFLMTLSTLRTKVRRFPFGWTLVSLTLVLAMLSCRSPWGLIVMLAAQTIPPAAELHSRGRSPRIFLIHMALFIGLLACGWAMIDAEGPKAEHSIWAIGMLIAAVLVRSGCVPVHCWMTDLFENASLGTALLFVTPMAGAYAAVRLVLPVAPDWALQTIALLSLFTAVYAAGMALVQREARRFFVYLFLSHSSLVLIGLEVVTPIGLTGGLCVWLSVGLSLAGLGLTLRALESRTGRLSLADYHGLYEHMPSLATFFLLTGLASVGFPGTVGFVGAELLVEGATDVYPYVGMLVVFAAALNGISVLHAYFRLFTGTKHTASISLKARLPEKIAVLSLSALIIGGGLVPQPGVSSRYHAATEIMARRHGSVAQSTTEHLAKSTPRNDDESLVDELRKLNPKKLVTLPDGALSQLDLSGSEATDETVRLLRNTKRLTFLNLSHTAISDEGVRDIAGMVHLTWLKLADTSISAAGLAHLKKLENLQTLDLSNTRCSKKAIDDVKAALPDCEVITATGREDRTPLAPYRAYDRAHERKS